MLQSKETLNKQVESWWNDNPFSFGVGANKYDQVGTIPLGEMDIAYFGEIERRFRKHSNGGAQEKGAPIFSNLMDYEWLQGKKVLEIAIGSGFALVGFIRQGVTNVTGIDITDFSIKSARKNLDLRNMDATLLKMDAQDMQFEDNTFDYVFAWGMYMHIPDTQKAINETYRVIKSGGKVMTYMYNRDSWAFWFNTILIKGILLGGFIKYKFDIVKLTSRYADGSTMGGNPLTKFYSKKQTKEMFKKAGFTNVQSVPFVLPNEPDHWPFRKFPVFKYLLPKSVKKHLARWSYGQIITGKKI